MVTALAAVSAGATDSFSECSPSVTGGYRDGLNKNKCFKVIRKRLYIWKIIYSTTI